MGRALQLLGYRVGGPFGVRDPDIASRALPDALERIRHYDAVQDNPWPLLFRELDEAVPGSRFVLTERPDDEWFASVVGHFGGHSTPMREWIYGSGHGDPAGDEDRYRRRYRRHNEEVRAWFAGRPDDLLVLHLAEGDGWDRLCPFLDRPVPDQPFPHVNRGGWATTAVNRARARVRRVLHR